MIQGLSLSYQADSDEALGSGVGHRQRREFVGPRRHSFEGGGSAQHQAVLQSTPDELQSDWQSSRRPAAWHADGGLAAEVERIRKGRPTAPRHRPPSDLRRRRGAGSEGRDGDGGRDEEVIALEESLHALPQRLPLEKRLGDVDSRQALAIVHQC